MTLEVTAEVVLSQPTTRLPAASPPESFGKMGMVSFIYYLLMVGRDYTKLLLRNSINDFPNRKDTRPF